MRVAFALDCCDREAKAHVATTGGLTTDDVKDLMVAAVEQRFGRVNRLPVGVEWLADNGSCYTAHKTRRFAARRSAASAADRCRPSLDYIRLWWGPTEAVNHVLAQR